MLMIYQFSISSWLTSSFVGPSEPEYVCHLMPQTWQRVPRIISLSTWTIWVDYWLSQMNINISLRSLNVMHRLLILREKFCYVKNSNKIFIIVIMGKIGNTGITVYLQLDDSGKNALAQCNGLQVAWICMRSKNVCVFVICNFQKCVKCIKLQPGKIFLFTLQLTIKIILKPNISNLRKISTVKNEYLIKAIYSKDWMGLTAA